VSEFHLSPTQQDYAVAASGRSPGSDIAAEGETASGVLRNTRCAGGTTIASASIDLVVVRARFAVLRDRSDGLVVKSKALRERSTRLLAESHAEIRHTAMIRSARATLPGGGTFFPSP
jgi:hypothetical protein